MNSCAENAGGDEVKPKVYLETTFPSLLTAWPSRDVSIAGQQQTTRDWWNERRQRYELFVSVLVMKEAERGDSKAAIECCQVAGMPGVAVSQGSRGFDARL